MKYFLIALLTAICFKSYAQTNQKTDIESIKTHLSFITKTEKPRNYKNIETLNFVTNYIKEELNKVCDSIEFQNFKVDKNEYKNVIGSISLKHQQRIIIGAHYDVCGDSDGADDNASGVVGLLELARLLSKEKLKYRIDFVAYSLEEPPFFRTKQMGSYIHANYLFTNKIDVKGMISLEMIGFYSDKIDSQQFPIPAMKNIYGNVGDFITVVQNDKNEAFGNEINALMKEEALLKTEAFKGNPSLSGIDFSDHLNYWKHDFKAVMITNTAFYRNKNYHTHKDKLKTLDLKRMSLVINQLYHSIRKIK